MIEEQISYISGILDESTRNSDDFKTSVEHTVTLDSLLYDLKSKFINYLIGYENPEVNLDIICFPKRYLGVSSIGDLPFQQEVIIRNVIRECFELGFVTHFLFTTSANRGCKINLDKLYYKFLPQSLVADVALKQYNLDNNGIPGKIIDLYYENEIKPKLNKYFNFGLFKRLRVRNSINNYYYCGILLGVLYDMEEKL